VTSFVAEAEPTRESVRISVRAADGNSEDGLDWSKVSAELLKSASPWRTFRQYKGAAPLLRLVLIRDHVIYDSRLEPARLLHADFDPAAQSISGAAFSAQGSGRGQPRRHVPDFLLVTDDGPIVADVKPRRYLSKEKIASTLAWYRAASENRGCRYEFWSEPPKALMANLRLLAGGRRKRLFAEACLTR
jgi:hypothetical protein